MNKSKIANIILAGVLALAVSAVGFAAYRQKIQADTIVPGYATLHLGLKVTVPEPQSLKIKAVAYPTAGGKYYYFKEREFELASAGVNTIEWYIRKIPAGNYSITVSSTSGNFSPENQFIEMKNDQVSERVSFELNLGEPAEISSPAPTPPAGEPIWPETTPSVEPSSTAVTPSSSETPLLAPPVPQLPS